MGANTSRSELNSFQKSVTDISKGVKSDASNLTDQELNLNQSIIVNNGTQLNNPCNDRFSSIEECIARNCQSNDPIYQCQLIRGNSPGAVTEQKCDSTFGFTYDEAGPAVSDCKDEDTPIPDGFTTQQYKTYCTNAIMRTKCTYNSGGDDVFINRTSCMDSNDIPCPYGTECVECSGDDCPSGSACAFKGKLGWVNDETCDNSCDSEILYIVETNHPNAATTITSLTKEESELGEMRNCAFYSPTDGESCYTIVNTGDFYTCSQVIGTGKNEGVSQEGCFEACRNTLGCTDAEIKLFQPATPAIIVEGGGSICFYNEADSSFVSNQITQSDITSEMVTDLVNDFSSTVTKTISQTNDGLNLGQSNGSDETTNLNQSIRNSISDSIKSSTSNRTTQISNEEQVIKFNNNGLIYVGENPQDCIEAENKEDVSPGECVVLDNGTVDNDSEADNNCGKGSFVLSNSNTSDFDSNQEAKSVVDTLMNNIIKNKITSDYDFTLTQLNKGFDPLAALMAYLVYLIIAAIVGVLAGGYIISKVFPLLTVIIRWFFIASIIGGIIFLILKFGTDMLDDKVEFSPKDKIEGDKNPSGNVNVNVNVDVDVDINTNPDSVQEGEYECKVNNMANATCKIFYKEGDLSDEEKAYQCSLLNDNLETSENECREAQCQELINGNIVWNGELLSMEICNQDYYEVRNFVNEKEGTRVVCIKREGVTNCPTHSPTSSPIVSP